MSSFSWLSYSEEERERTRNLISQFSERDTRDELGIGRIRDAFSDLLFPGTTTIQTRVKYFLFIPWMYLDLEEQRVSSEAIDQRRKRYEGRIRDALLENDNPEGVIGRYSKDELQRYPSNIYWSGLQTWDIREYKGSQSDYHRDFNQYYEQENGELKPTWHSRLPEPPEEFPDQVMFDLRPKEAAYIKGRIENGTSRSMLKQIVHISELAGTAEYPWEYSHLDEVSEKVREYVDHAENLSDVIHGATILYNLMLAERMGDITLEMQYLSELDEWKRKIRTRQEELEDWNQQQFWKLIKKGSANVPQPMKVFVSRWIEIVINASEGVDNNQEARNLIEKREVQLKRGRAQLTNKSAREGWDGAGETSQLAYRWSTAKSHLQDILAGLEGA